MLLDPTPVVVVIDLGCSCTTAGARDIILIASQREHLVTRTPLAHHVISDTYDLRNGSPHLCSLCGGPSQTIRTSV